MLHVAWQDRRELAARMAALFEVGLVHFFHLVATDTRALVEEYNCKE